MSTKKLRMEEAYEYVRSRRRIVSPNFNFMGQLLNFESKLFAELTKVGPVLDPIRHGHDGSARTALSTFNSNRVVVNGGSGTTNTTNTTTATTGLGLSINTNPGANSSSLVLNSGSSCGSSVESPEDEEDEEDSGAPTTPSALWPSQTSLFEFNQVPRDYCPADIFDPHIHLDPIKTCKTPKLMTPT